MSEPVTLEDIYQLFRASAEEYDRLVAQSKAEYDRHRVEIENLLAESKLESRSLDGRTETHRRTNQQSGR